MARRYVSDTARANWSSFISAVVGVGAALALAAVDGRLDRADTLRTLIDVYLFAWPAFGVVYLVWTHRVYGQRGPRALGATARREKELSGRWWTALVGYRSASSWTLTAALVAVFVTILIAQDAQHRSSWVYVVLGLLCVATSWALMVYAFALQYLRLAAGDDADARHIEIEADGDAVFGDYLTLAVLLSTAAATISARIRTRKAWLLVRTNVIFAFTFNSVIVAMVVSLLLGGLVG